MYIWLCFPVSCSYYTPSIIIMDVCFYHLVTLAFLLLSLVTLAFIMFMDLEATFPPK
jgi:hypothetical protein